MQWFIFLTLKIKINTHTSKSVQLKKTHMLEERKHIYLEVFYGECYKSFPEVVLDGEKAVLWTAKKTSKNN